MTKSVPYGSPQSKSKISHLQSQAMTELILGRYEEHYRDKQSAFTPETRKKILEFESRVREASNQKPNPFTCYQTMIFSTLTKTFRKWNKVEIGKEFDRIMAIKLNRGGKMTSVKRPFDLIRTENHVVRNAKRRKISEDKSNLKKIKLEGMATKLGHNMKQWRRSFDSFLEYAPSDHPYRAIAIEGLSRCDKLKRRLECGEIEQVHESEKAEHHNRKVEVETFRLRNKMKNLNTLKPLGMAGLIKTFESIPKGEKPKSERVIPDVADFLHRTEPSSDGVFKVSNGRGKVLDSVCPVNPQSIWDDMYQLEKDFEYEEDSK